MRGAALGLTDPIDLVYGRAFRLPSSGAPGSIPAGNGVSLALSAGSMIPGATIIATVTVLDAFGAPVASAAIDSMSLVGIGVAQIVGSIPANTNASGQASFSVRAMAVGEATLSVVVAGERSNVVPIVVQTLVQDISPTVELVRVNYRKRGRH